jgi:hypothetical protein
MLLAVLATHLALASRNASASAIFASACAVALGGCLWFVAARQISPAAGLFAMGLYVFAPTAWHADRAAASALAVFVLLMTAVGVGHALQCPARKWPPRFALLAVCMAAAALLQPWLGVAAVVAAAGALLYLSERRRTWAASVVLGTAAVAASAAPWHGRLIAHWPAPPPTSFHAWHWAGILIAVAAALGLWAANRRSRFFGHTAPLLAAALFAGLAGAGVSDAAACAAAPALLFAAGVFADGFHSRGHSSSRSRWRVLAVCACAVQASALFLFTS